MSDNHAVQSNGVAVEKAHTGNSHVAEGYAPAPATRGVTPGGHSIDQSQPAFPVYHRRFANPAPLGLAAFATTTFVLSLVNVHARGIATPNIAISLAFGYGGLVQLLAGMWEFAAGNTFGATAFSSYGGFWLSYAAILIPWFNVASGYTDAAQVPSVLGFYLASWFIFTTIMFIASLRSSIALVALFGFLDITFLLLMAAEFSGSAGVGKAGGWFGLITAMIAYYTAAAGLLTADTSLFILPVGSLARND